MKSRLYSFVLILMCVVLAVPAFSSAEEKYTQRYTIASVTKDVEISAKKIIDWTESYCYQVESTTERQPLIFEGTAGKPKTAFSYMTLDEINQLPDEIEVVTIGSDGVVYRTEYFENRLKKLFLEIEKIFEYRKQSDGTLKKVLRVKATRTKTSLENLTFEVDSRELRLLYEQLAAIYYEYFGEGVIIDEYIDDTSYEKIKEICRHADIDRLRWNANKTPEQKAADKAYILDALLCVSEEEFGGVLTLLVDQIYKYVFASKKGSEYTLRIAPEKYGKK